MESKKEQNILSKEKEVVVSKEKTAEMSFDQAVNLFIERGREIKEKKEPELVAVYGQPNSGKSFFTRKVMEGLIKEKILVGIIQTSDSPENDLKQFNELKENHPDYKSPFIFFHEISLGGVDLFTLEQFGKFADLNLYIFDPKTENIDPGMVKKAIEFTMEIWSKKFGKDLPRTNIIYISNPQTKVK